MAKRREIADHPSGETTRHRKHAPGQNADEAVVREQIQRRKQLEIINLFGKVDFHPNFDYKFERRRKRTGIENADE
jgi:hypothetical protein